MRRCVLAGGLLALLPTRALAQCELRCSVTAESHTIALSCESGATSEKLSDQTSYEYTPSGSVGVLRLALDRERTYTATNHTYRLTGTIRVDKAAGTASYDIRATGGLLGAGAATCKAGSVPLPAPPPRAATTSGAAPPGQRSQKLNLAVAADYQAAINVPACLDAFKKSGPTFACFVGEPREYISQGKTWLLPAREPAPTAELFFDRVTVNVPDGKQSWERWEFSFSPPKGSGWRIGPYDNVVKDGLHDSERAGLAIRGHSSGCNEVAGRFEILELVADATTRTVERFAANFEQACDKTGRLRGIVRFNSTIGR